MDIGPQADIYGLGATAYHMVTGQVPFSGKNPSEVMHRHLKTPLQPPDELNNTLSANFCHVVEMMLAKSLDDRYQTADDLLEDLELLHRGEAPHFAKPKLDLSGMEVTVASPEAVGKTVEHTQGDTGIPGWAIASVAANAILLLLLIVLAIA